MKEIPILYSTPMVQAILRNCKNQTRRIIKFELNTLHTHYGFTPIPECNVKLLGDWYLSSINNFNDGILSYSIQSNVDDYYDRKIKCPYGQIGDVLWVRETWTWEGETKYTDMDPIGQFFYKADFEKREGPTKWKPSIFMPREACRIKLLITDIRVERLQDISEEDAINEGIEFQLFPNPQDLDWQPIKGYKIYGSKNSWNENPIVSYRSLWESINGKDSWNKNLWVWVIKFERI